MTRNIGEIYEHYKIMPNLAEHQRRVAAVAEQICRSFDEKLHVAEVISACLLHDMGNILKFDLISFPQFLEPQGLAYWQEIKNDFEKKYGVDEHNATLRIAKEIGVFERTFEYIDAIGFSKAGENARQNDFGKKICAYADMRVGPFGILTLEERFADGKKRYENRKTGAGLTLSSWQRAEMAGALSDIERQIFSRTKIGAGDISDSSIATAFEEFKNFEIV